MEARNATSRHLRSSHLQDFAALTARVLGPALCLAVGATFAQAQAVRCWFPTGRIDAPTHANHDQFSLGMALQGTTLLVGSLARTRVETFERGTSGWTLGQYLTGADTVVGDWFGCAVDFDGDTAVVGARFDDDQGSGSGAAYVFVRNGSAWTQQAKLLPPVGASLDGFGFAVAIEGDRLVVGAVNGDGLVADSGTAHVFERTAGVWTWVTRLQLPDGSAGEEFGSEIAIDGDRIVVGAPIDGAGPYARGSASLFERSGGAWPLTARLRPSTTANARFGAAIAIVDSQIFVGGPSDSSSTGFYAGAVWVFEQVSGTWIESAILRSIDSDQNDNFGSDLAYDDGRLIIGASRDDDSAAGLNSSGAAYVFEKVGGVWTERVKLLGAEYDFTEMGTTVACEGTTVLAGAPYEDEYGSNTGTVYEFELVLAPQVYCTAQTNSLGCVPGIWAHGKPTGSGLVPFDLYAGGLINQKSGLLCYSLGGPQSVPLNGGYLCVRAPFRRMPMQETLGAPTGISCTGTLHFDFAERVRLGHDPALVAGTYVWAQFWSRDPFAPASTNSTAALEFRLCGP